MNQNKKLENEKYVIMYNFYENSTFLILKEELEERVDRERKKKFTCWEME